MVWLRDQMPQTEEGQQQWKDVLADLNRPIPVPRSRRGRDVPAHAYAVLPAGAPVTGHEQAAALSAFMGTVGE